MSSPGLIDHVCIAGVGATQQGKLPGRSADDLVVWAVREALADAGIEKSQVDGLIIQQSFNNQGDVRTVGHRLGIEPSLAVNVSCQGEALMTGLMLLATGLCEVVVLGYGTNQKTIRNYFAPSAYHVGGNFDAVYGLASPASTASFLFRRRMHEYGETEEQLGAIAVAESKAAALNPLAVYREELTIEDYLSAPYVIAPLRLYDFCMVSDGAFATILVGADRAKYLAKPPVWISGLGYHTGFSELADPNALLLPSHQRSAERLWSSTDYRQSDIDLLYVQDPYTPVVLAVLEDYGFCEPGTAGAWIQNGRIHLGGQLPINVNGGQNRMTYMVGWQHTFDAVKQLRSEAQEPQRQAVNCGVALCVFSQGVGQETFSFIYRI
jgi:acetyl-CoA acetyltransferase